MCLWAYHTFLPCFSHRIFVKLTADIYLLRCLRYVRLKVISSKVIVKGIQLFAVSALWLRAYLTDLLYIWHKYHPLGANVLHTISMSKSLRSRSRGSFEINVTLVIRLFCRVRSVAPWLADSHTVSRSTVKGHSNFLPCPWFCVYLTGSLYM